MQHPHHGKNHWGHGNSRLGRKCIRSIWSVLPHRLDGAVAILLCELLVAGPPLLARGPERLIESRQPDLSPLRQDLKKSYLELFSLSPKLHFTDAEIEDARKQLKDAEQQCVDRVKEQEKDYDSQLQLLQDEVKSTKDLPEKQRHDLHCRIQNLRALKAQMRVLQHHAIPIAYHNEEAKLDLIQKWPPELQQIQQQIADGSYRSRRWGDVQDIGFRQIAAGQKDDVKSGEDAIQQMKQAGLMPKELDNPAITSYVSSVAWKVADHSDLRVPLKVTILDSKEVNAFALPGGFLFVQRGLLEAADDESELAGVLAHEMAHVVARHGHKLMRKETIASIFYQGAELAAILLTGGAASIGTYYALRYGFYGLGLALNLKLLGVSREYELEADQLGLQYAWNSGYDPSGFIRFFDKMASREGYVEGISWFYDHPPFYERMVDAEREIDFLPKKDSLTVQTSEFENMKKALTEVTASKEEEDKDRPSLLAPEQGCASPPVSKEEAGRPFDAICSPSANPAGANGPTTVTSGTTEKGGGKQ